MLVDTKPDDVVVREEIFGPVIVALPFSDVDDLARQANDSEYGLAAGVWSASRRVPSGSTSTMYSAQSCRPVASSKAAGARNGRGSPLQLLPVQIGDCAALTQWP